MCYAPVLSLRLAKEGSVAHDRAVRDASDAAAVAREVIGDLDREAFLVLALNAKNRLIGANLASLGSVTGTPVSPREVFKFALLSNAVSVIVCHNHPSGDPFPSREDVGITRALVQAGKLIGVDVLDHVVVEPGGRYFSLKESAWAEEAFGI